MKPKPADKQIVSLNIQLEVPAGKADLIQTLLENYLENGLFKEDLEDYQSTWQLSMGAGSKLIEWEVWNFNTLGPAENPTPFNLFAEFQHILFTFKKDDGQPIKAAVEITGDALWFFVEPYKEAVAKLDLSYAQGNQEDSQGFIGVPHILVMDTAREECVAFGALVETGTKIYFECGVQDLGPKKGPEGAPPRTKDNTPTEDHIFGYEER